MLRKYLSAMVIATMMLTQVTPMGIMTVSAEELDLGTSITADKVNTNYVPGSIHTNLTGTVLDSNGQAVAGAIIHWKSDNTAISDLYATTTTTGVYSFTNVPSGMTGKIYITLSGTELATDFQCVDTIASANFRITAPLYTYSVIVKNEDTIVSTGCTVYVNGNAASYSSDNSSYTVYNILYPTAVVTVRRTGYYDVSLITQNTTSTPTTIDLSKMLYVNDEVVDGETHSGYEDLLYISIGSDVTTIEAGGFSNNKTLTSIVTTDDSKLTVIGNGAFEGNESLKYVKLPSTVTSLGHSVFKDCSSLEELVIPSQTSSTMIPSNLCENATSLKSVVIPNGTTSIGSEAFSNCTGLTTVTLPASVNSLSPGAFIGCSNLKTLTILSPTLEPVYSDGSNLVGTLGTGVTIACLPNSAAFTYASANGYAVKLINADGSDYVPPEKDTYTLTYSSPLSDTGASIPPAKTYEIEEVGTAITLPDAPVRTGYIFCGWNVSSTALPTDVGNMIAGSEYILTASDITLHAIWKEEDKFELTFNKGCADEVVVVNMPSNLTVTEEDGEEYQLPILPPEREGATFEGWLRDDTLFTPGATVDLAEGVEFTAIWKNSEGKRLITLHYPTKTIYDIPEASAHIIQPDITDTSKTFVGYRVNYVTGTSTDIVKITDSYTIPTNIFSVIFEPVYTEDAITYTLTFNSNVVDTTSVTNMPDAYTHTSLDVLSYTLPTTIPVREGYTFKGWSKTTEGAEIIPANSSYTLSLEDETLYAIWEVKIDGYNITFDYNLPEGVTIANPMWKDTVIPKNSTTYTLPLGIGEDINDPSEDGFTNMAVIVVDDATKDIAGYYIGNLESLNIPVKGDTTIRLIWTDESVKEAHPELFCIGWTNTIEYEDGTMVRSLDGFAPIQLSSTAPVKEGFTFEGWNYKYILQDSSKNNGTPYEVISSTEPVPAGYIIQGADLSEIGNKAIIYTYVWPEWKEDELNLTYVPENAGKIIDGILYLNNDYIAANNYLRRTDFIGVSFNPSLSGVTIGETAFYGCTNLKGMNIDKAKISNIATRALAECTNLTEITLPESLTSLGSYVFEGDIKLKKATLPKSINFIPEGTFKDCTSLNDFIFNDNCTAIGNEAFIRTAFEIIDIPASIKSIGTDVFKDMPNLKIVVVRNPDMTFPTGNNPFQGDDITMVFYGYPGSTTETFCNTYGYTFKDIATYGNSSPVEPPVEDTSEDTSKEPPSEDTSSEPATNKPSGGGSSSSDDEEFYISGKVVNSKGTGISGVTVTLEGQGVSTKTSSNGNYSFTVYNLNGNTIIIKASYKYNGTTYTDSVTVKNFSNSISVEDLVLNFRTSGGGSSGGGGGGSSSTAAMKDKDETTTEEGEESTEENTEETTSSTPSTPTTPTNKEFYKGYPDNTFKPNNTITRAEVAQLLSNLGQKSNQLSKYNDVSSDAWYYEAVISSAFSGYNDGTFKPNNNITRAEMASIISRIKDITGYSAKGMTDLTTNAWYAPAVCGLLEKGIMSGYPDNTFRPSASITRAEAVITLQRAFGLSVGISPEFSDVNNSDWFATK